MGLMAKLKCCEFQVLKKQEWVGVFINCDVLTWVLVLFGSLEFHSIGFMCRVVNSYQAQSSWNNRPWGRSQGQLFWGLHTSKGVSRHKVCFIKSTILKNVHWNHKVPNNLPKCPKIYCNSLAPLKGKLCFTKPAPTNLVLENQGSDLWR